LLFFYITKKFWVSTNTAITGITGITSEYRKNTDYSIYKESPSHAVIMMLPAYTVHHVLQYYFRFTARFNVKFEKPESRNHRNQM